MPIPESVYDAMVGWRPCDLAVLDGMYEETERFRCLRTLICDITNYIFLALGIIDEGQWSELQGTAMAVLQRVQECQLFLDELNPETMMSDEMRELDIYVLASEEMAWAFIRLGDGARERHDNVGLDRVGPVTPSGEGEAHVAVRRAG